MDNMYSIAAVWVGLALIASLVSVRLGVSVALLEIAMGVLGGNLLGLQTNAWIDFLAGFGAVLLTFLAGAEIDPPAFRRHFRASVVIGIIAFVIPAGGAFVVARLAGWPLQAAEIAALALSTTSVAVVYAVLVESGIAGTEIGKLILAACFVNDLGTVIGLGVLFADVNGLLVAMIFATAAGLVIGPPILRWFVRAMPGRVSEPEIKFVFLMLLALGGLSTAATGEAVLPAYLLGLVFAGVFLHDGVLVPRMRAIAFSILTPFYFIKAGLYVSAPAVAAGAGLIVVFLLVKLATKAIGVWPSTQLFRMPRRDSAYTTLLMSTGLTFGTIASLFGLQNHLIDQSMYTVLVTVVILSAVVPTLFATTFFEPRLRDRDERDAVDAAEEIDAGPLRHPNVTTG